VSGPFALRTRVEERDGAARFVIEGADARAADRLPRLGYLPAGDGRFATRWFPDAADARRRHERFAAALEPMVLQSARLAPVPWEDALLEALGRLDGSGVRWWLYGSAALAVRGLAVAPGDVDLHVSDAHRAGRLFDDLLVTPVERLDGWVARWVGRAFCGAIVEWLAEPNAALDDPAAPHEQGPYVASAIEVVAWRGHRVPVPPLAAQLRTCERHGRRERAALIRAAMETESRAPGVTRARGGAAAPPPTASGR
jgi:hypothetical protein